MIDRYPDISAIDVINLTKIYGRSLRSVLSRFPKTPAVNDASLSVTQGEIVAVIGPTGAGKTTLVKSILGLVRPTSGTVYIGGWKNTSTGWKPLAGYLPEGFRSNPMATPLSILRLMGRLRNMTARECSRRTLDLLSLLELHEVKHEHCKKLSRGMLLRVGIAQALIHRPRIVVLDEPTAGLDPIGKRIIRDVLRSLKDDGVAVVITSHLLTEVEEMADRIAMMASGRLTVLPETGASLRESNRTLEEVFSEHLKEAHA